MEQILTDNIVKQLEFYRLKNKITQETFAKNLGVAFSAVNRWFNDKIKPSKVQQYHIEKFINTKQIKVKKQ